MKIIESEGGPLIGINTQDIARWSGVFGNNFFKGNYLTDNDYEALCSVINRIPAPVVGVLSNDGVSFFFISDPFPTLIVDAGPSHLFLVQIDTSEEGWSESELRASDFEGPIEWCHPVEFDFLGGEIVFFDSAGRFDDVDNEYLVSKLEKGTYVCEWARQKWDGQANLIFIRILKRGTLQQHAT